MGADARQQNVLSDDSDHLPLLSNKQPDNDVISSLAHVVKRPRMGRQCPRREK
jgi:hypothetical protein